MASLNAAFGTLADDDMWEDAVAALAGYLAPTALRNVIEPKTGLDLPDEAYGALVMAGGQYSPMYSSSISLGGGIYVADKLTERFGLQQAVTGIGTGGNN
ncbi:hypothetical protein [Haloarchaeobius sp. DT45]|uniref:hypothetical protein n=1 Tax=Haloarchaeobius sp. DT45 TaxID=3446116 RepID=UPI003F6CF60D